MFGVSAADVVVAGPGRHCSGEAETDLPVRNAAEYQWCQFWRIAVGEAVDGGFASDDMLLIQADLAQSEAVAGHGDAGGGVVVGAVVPVD